MRGTRSYRFHKRGRLPVTERVFGGSEQDSIDARGEIRSLRVGDIVAGGRFTTELDGSFRVRGDCA